MHNYYSYDNRNKNSFVKNFKKCLICVENLIESIEKMNSIKLNDVDFKGLKDISGVK